MKRPDDAARMVQYFETLQGRAADRERDERRLRIARAAAAFLVYAVVILVIAVLGAWALNTIGVAAHTLSNPVEGMPW